MIRNPILPILRLAALLLPGVHVARALELADSRWGFDGSLLPNRVNVISARFFNPDPQAFDGVVRLQKTGFAGHQGAVHEARVYVSPQTYRWVQFAVEPEGIHDTYALLYPLTPKRTEKKEFTDLTLGAPSRVLLLDSRDTTAIPPRIPAFPAEAFPSSVSGLEALEQVVLDHVPDWDAPRRQALLDWLHLGGVLHLLRDREGKIPHFDGTLAGLNGTGPSSSLGAGVVVRHPFSRAEATDARLDEAGFGRSAWNKPEQNAYYGYGGGLSSGLLQALRRSILPHHPWGWINLILLGYIGLVGPGQYLLVKRRNLDYRVSLLILVSLVGLFSVIFYQIGLRGYKNPSLVLSVTQADALPGDRAALTQWAQAFTRKGRTAEFSHASPSGIYDMPGTTEAIPATARNGAQALLSASMPVNSTLPFVYRGVATLALPSLHRIPGEPNRLRMEGTLPAEMVGGYVWHMRTLYRLTRDGDFLVMGNEPEKLPQNPGYMGSARMEGDTGDLQAFLLSSSFRQKVLPTWVGMVMGLRRGMQNPDNPSAPWLQAPAWRENETEVWIITPALPASAVKDDPLPAHLGLTLLHWRLPLASPSPTP